MITTYFLPAIGWFAFSYVYISIGEHQIHKRLMHRKKLPAWVYRQFPYVLDAFEAHAVRHHTRWYREFDYEPDPVGRNENIPIPLKESLLMLVAAFPLWSPIFWVSTFGGCVFIATAFLHNNLWSVLHRQMHIPRDVFFRDWALYRFVAMNHFMHHQDTNRHLNVAFPFADFLFGTRTQPRFGDIREMLRLGYIKPRSELAKRWIRRTRQAIAARRQALA
jgi:hypothetical protein